MRRWQYGVIWNFLHISPYKLIENCRIYTRRQIILDGTEFFWTSYLGGLFAELRTWLVWLWHFPCPCLFYMQSKRIVLAVFSDCTDPAVQICRKKVLPSIFLASLKFNFCKMLMYSTWLDIHGFCTLSLPEASCTVAVTSILNIHFAWEDLFSVMLWIFTWISV